MTSKINYGFLAIAMVAIFGLSVAPVMNSAHATTTYVTSFGVGQETCANSLPPANNYGTANSDGDLTSHSDTDGSSSSGVATAWAWNKVYFTSGTSVTMLAKGTVDIDVTDGHAHVSAYLAPLADMSLTSLTHALCAHSGNVVPGSNATIETVNWNGSESGLRAASSSFTIPTSGWYAVVIYVDASTTTNGGPAETDVDNPLIRLTY